LHTYFAHIAVSSTVIDDVTYQIKRRIFNTDLQYSRVSFHSHLIEKFSLHWQVIMRFIDELFGPPCRGKWGPMTT